MMFDNALVARGVRTLIDMGSGTGKLTIPFQKYGSAGLSALTVKPTGRFFSVHQCSLNDSPTVIHYTGTEMG